MEKRIKEEFIMEKYLDSIYYSDTAENSVKYIEESFCPSNMGMRDMIDEGDKCASGEYCETCWLVSSYKKIKSNDRKSVESYK